MCGLVGSAGTLEHFDDDIMKKMLLFDYFRGKDSTGLASVNRHDWSVKLFKRAVDPITAFDMQSFKDVLRPSLSGVFIGHNRAATKGKVNHANAHPFQHGDITLAHNGTLSPLSFVDLKKLLDRPDLDVDSEAICVAIDEFGIEEVAPMLQGAWALTWFDKSDKTLNWFRNDKRPFWYGYSKDLKKVYWASEWGIINAAMSVGTGTIWPELNKLDMYVDEEQDTSFWKTKPDVWYKWDMEAIVKDGFGKVSAEIVELKGKEPDPVEEYDLYGGYDPFGRDIPENSTSNTDKKTGGNSTMTALGSPPNGTTQTGTTSASTKKGPQKNHSCSKTSTTTSRSDANNVVQLFGDENDPLAGVISREDFEILAKNGCSWCQADVQYGDPGVTIFERDRTILCNDCCNTDSSEDQARIVVENIKQFI